MIQKPTFTAGETKEFYDLGDFFRLMSSSAEVTVRFYFQGREIFVAEGVTLGYAERFIAGQFDRFTVYSAQAQTLQFVARLGNEVSYDVPPTGAVTISNTAGAFTQSQKTVTNASTSMLAANAARRYLLIQNNDPGGDIYVTLDGTAATTAKGIKIAAGGSYECQGYAPTGQIFAIGSIANNPNVVTVEG